MVSIIIPTLNEVQYLPRLLASIQNQDYTDYEVIVADAGSTDGTQALAKAKGCRVVSGGSPAKGRNEGAREAKGSFLLFLDADAMLPEGFLRSLFSIVQARNISIAGCALFFDQRGLFFRLGEGLWTWYYWMTQRILPHATNCIFIKRDIHERIGGFDERILLGEEFDYVRRGNKAGKFVFLLAPRFIASARRVQKEGALRVFLVYLIAEVIMTLGVKITWRKFPYRFYTYEKKDYIS